MLYGDNKPSEDAIDRVVGKINKECVNCFCFAFPRVPPISTSLLTSSVFLLYSIDKKGKFSRKRLNEDEGDITYINERNRVFNKKVRDCLLPTIASYSRTLLSFRSRDTMINTHQRSGQASSGVLHFDSAWHALFCVARAVKHRCLACTHMKGRGPWFYINLWRDN